MPESHRLSDDDLTAFVETVLPVVLVGMYAPGGSAKSSEALKNLAMLRPQLVIPPLIERYTPGTCPLRNRRKVGFTPTLLSDQSA